jgi:CubicO group peptidase (beta-lactamase class C family)
MDVGKKKPMQKDAIFRIASMTKPVTSVAIMMLVEQGKLSLDDPVSKFIPSFKNRPMIATFNKQNGQFTTKQPAHEVKIRHLLSNTSGLAYTFANAEADKVQKALKRAHMRNGEAEVEEAAALVVARVVEIRALPARVVSRSRTRS